MFVILTSFRVSNTKRNDIKWPDGRRQISYLSDRRDTLKDYALWSPNYQAAKTFDTEASARDWFAEMEALRAHPYGGHVRITTVADLKVLGGYEIEVDRHHEAETCPSP